MRGDKQTVTKREITICNKMRRLTRKNRKVYLKDKCPYIKSISSENIFCDFLPYPIKSPDACWFVYLNCANLHSSTTNIFCIDKPENYFATKKPCTTRCLQSLFSLACQGFKIYDFFPFGSNFLSSLRHITICDLTFAFRNRLHAVYVEC